MKDDQDLDLHRKEENFLWGRETWREQLTGGGDDHHIYGLLLVKVERMTLQTSFPP